MTQILPLHDAERPEAGGKALGLARLLRLGLPVPPGVVLIEPDGAALEELLRPHVQPGTRYAVRSSAVDEDGQTHSFAGMFHTELDCEGLPGVVAGVEACLRADGAQRVQAYGENLAEGRRGDHRLAVVIQRMVDARQAGVLFTADPVSGRRDRWTLSTTMGAGDSLVGGRTDGALTTLAPTGAVLSGRSLPSALHDALVAGARALQDDLGGPVDVEFAIDDDDRLWWLQARPVTALPKAHLNELDDVVDEPGATYTTANVSEMLPGPVTPLSQDVVVRALDRGMQDYFVRIGAQAGLEDRPYYIFTGYQHLFIRLDALYASARVCAGASKRDIDLAILGRPVPEVPLGRRRSLPRRLLNLGRLVLYLRQAPKRVETLRSLAHDYRLEDDGTPEGLLRALGGARELLCEAYSHHYAASVQSGTWLGVANGAIAGRGQVPTPEQLALVAALLSDIEGVESADAVRALDRLADVVQGSGRADAFLELEPAAAHHWLHHDASADVRAAVEDFERRHGHRGLREAELRTKPWAEEPAAWTRLLQLRVKQEGARAVRAPRDTTALLAALPKGTQRTLRFALPRARQGVAARERTKAHVIRFQHHIRVGYRRLAERLVERGQLPDVDLVWFLRHAELGELIAGDASRVALALDRRRIFPMLWTLSFPELTIGVPDPSEPEPDGHTDADLRGVPVSRGRVTGRAFIARAIEDAERLQPGDILIAKTTDVGWSPWFAIVGGIVTEIGSPLSHGAVVAREYGIPAVVAVKGALGLRHGATITLDGDAGTVTVVDEA